MNPGFDSDRVNQAIRRYLGQAVRQVGLNLVGPGQVFITVQRIVQVDRQEIGIDIRRLGRVEAAGSAVHCMPVNTVTVVRSGFGG